MKKKKLIAAAIVACVAGALSSCGDDAPAPTGPTKEADLKDIIADAAQSDTIAAPADAEVRTQLLPLLADFPAVNLSQVQVDTSPLEEGDVLVAARVQVSVGENLYLRENAPESLNEERRAANDSLNRAMMPEAHYLLQAGATAEEITDADREARALPPELQPLASEMKALAEQSVYHLRMPAGTVVELAASLTAHRREGVWEFNDVRFDTAPLSALVSLTAESAMPKDANIVNEGFETRNRLALREKVEAFNQAAEPYIRSREDAARKRMLEQRSRAEEAAKAAAEQEELKAAAKAQWDKLLSGVLRDGALFTGEWKRGDVFGRISLRMTKIQKTGDAVQFTGLITDPSLPQVELQVVGRLEQPARADDAVPVVVHIYSGRYDPDVPTAEVFDAKDAILKLNMAQDGSAQGVLTCASWLDTPDKGFLVNLRHSTRKQALPIRPAQPARPAQPRPAAQPARAPQPKH